MLISKQKQQLLWHQKRDGMPKEIDKDFRMGKSYFFDVIDRCGNQTVLEAKYKTENLIEDKKASNLEQFFEVIAWAEIPKGWKD